LIETTWKLHHLQISTTPATAPQGRTEPLASGDRAAQGRVGRRVWRWQERELSARSYVYVWADGVYLQTRMEPQAECVLVLIGATPQGTKELIGFQTSMRESAQSWKEHRTVCMKGALSQDTARLCFQASNGGVENLAATVRS
jgi:hypothetical protein